MSTFLEICQELREECGITGSTSSSPTTVVSQTGELKRLVRWCKQSYLDIQNKSPNWRWLRSSFTVSVTSGDGIYSYGDCTDTGDSAVISRFARWYPHDFKIYLTSAGSGTEHWLLYQQWDDFRSVYRVGTQNNGYPAWVGIDPTNRIMLGPVPDATYTLSGEYQKSAQILAADATEPEMPSRFHRLIVLEAMKKYAAYSAAPEVWAAAVEEARPLWLALQQDQLPASGYGDPIA